MKASIRAATEKAFEWLSVAVGLLILGSCTYAGFGKSEGVAVSVGLVVLGVITAVAVVAFVFMMTRTSADIRAIRDRLDKSEPGE
jgi:hypothetical protein